MKVVNGARGFRLIARIFPLKYRLSFLIRRYLDSDEEISVPFFGKFRIAISPNQNNRRTIADLIFEGANYLPEYSLVRDIKKVLPADFVYVDVGANIGTTVWLFAGTAGSITAFEPIPALAEVIQRSIHINRAQGVTLVKKAVGNSVGWVSMLDNDNSSVTPDDRVGSLRLELTTLDVELMSFGRIDLMKIDVEGFEMKVLEGGEYHSEA